MIRKGNQKELLSSSKFREWEEKQHLVALVEQYCKQRKLNIQDQINITKVYLENYQQYVKSCDAVLKKNDNSAKSLFKFISDGQILSKNLSNKIQFLKKLDNDFQISDCSNEGKGSLQYELGVMHYFGIGVKQSYTDSFKFFEEASNLGYVNASHYLALFFYYGNGNVEQSFKKAFEYFNESADNGSKYSQFITGLMYNYGIGIDQSFPKAFECFEKSANQGYSLSQLNLGLMYENGTALGIRSVLDSIKWLEKSAKQDNEFAKVCLRKLSQINSERLDIEN